MPFENTARQSFLSVRSDLQKLIADSDNLQASHLKLKEIIESLDKAIILLDKEQINSDKLLNQALLDNHMSKEVIRTSQPVKPPGEKGPHHIEG